MGVTVYNLDVILRLGLLLILLVLDLVFIFLKFLFILRDLKIFSWELLFWFLFESFLFLFRSYFFQHVLPSVLFHQMGDFGKSRLLFPFFLQFRIVRSVHLFSPCVLGAFSFKLSFFILRIQILDIYCLGMAWMLSLSLF